MVVNKDKHERRIRFGTLGMVSKKMYVMASALDHARKNLDARTDPLTRAFLDGKIEGMTVAREALDYVYRYVERHA